MTNQIDFEKIEELLGQVSKLLDIAKENCDNALEKNDEEAQKLEEYFKYYILRLADDLAQINKIVFDQLRYMLDDEANIWIPSK